MSVVARMLLTIALIVAPSAWPQAASTQVRTPESVKAEYFFLMSRLASWPASTAGGRKEIVELCLLGGDAALFQALQSFDGESIHGAKLRARHYHRTAFLDGCSAVFVSRSERAILPRVMAYFAGRPILTVSDISGFAARGGMIELIEAASRVRFLANPWCARQVGIEIDPRLLELAENVTQLDQGVCP